MNYKKLTPQQRKLKKIKKKQTKIIREYYMEKAYQERLGRKLREIV